MARSKTNITVVSKFVAVGGPQRAALVVIQGAELGRKYDLTRAKLQIGRAAECDVQVDQDAVSRAHAELEVDGDTVHLDDLKSTNGTFVNDTQLHGRVMLKNGDLVKIGRTVFKFISGGNIETVYHDEIYRLTTVDGLTQIANRRFFDEAVEREISRCQRYRRPVSLLMLDIDHFKRVNDTHGHLAGDAVLRHITRTLEPKLRREDVFARYGGEEFAILLPELALAEARVTAEKARKLVEESVCAWEGKPIACTVSIGAAVLGEDMAESSALIQAADKQLYRAKNEGRNRVCF